MAAFEPDSVLADYSSCIEIDDRPLTIDTYEVERLQVGVEDSSAVHVGDTVCYAD
jgi:hypothetical protein